VEELHPKRDLSRNPLFQVFFNMADHSDTKMTLPPLKVEPLPLPLEFVKFDMTVYCFEEGDRLSLRIDYSTDLFQAGTVRRLLRHYQNLLAAVVEDPDCPISVMPLFSKEERSKLKARCNEIGPTNPYREFKPIEIEQTISERFLEQVQQYPERIAIKTLDEEWTYRRLEVEANRIAHAIDSQTTADCQNVALLFEHGADTIAAMLGVLKAGCAYVPLDPSYPQQRLAFIVEDSQASVIITNGQYIDLAHRLVDGARPIIDVDHLKGDVGPFASLAKPDSLAYILYTSGSTGQPKGVMQNHRNVLHHIRIYSNSLHIAPEDRLTLLPSYTFDGAVMDIYGALLNGATLYPYNIRDRGLAGLPAWLDRESVTIYHSTPSVFRYFIGMLNKDQVLLHLRFVVLGGEEVLRNDMELYKNHFAPHCLFVNGLGPSESTLALQYFMNHDVKIERLSVPAGYPVADTETVLIDDMGEEVDFYGEIGIRSAHLSLGYWQRPELTQTAFLSDAAHTPQRTYRTGDMGRMLPDGSIEFAGRKDLQVKIRGIRIELGEINTMLTKHPAVHQAITITRKDGRDEKQLVAYVVPSDSHKLSTRDLRNYLRQRLADFMIPAAYVILDTLPLTPNGKIDYRALPEPLQVESEAAFVAPRNDIEKHLAGMWADLLRLERIGIHDNFFELGGQSLIATQVMARLQKALGVELPLRCLFQAPTIAGLAAAVDEARSAGAVQRVPDIGRISRETHHFPTSFSQQRLWFLEQLTPGRAVYNMSRSLRLKGQLDVGALEHSLNEIVRRHEVMRTTFASMEDEPVQIVTPPVAVRLPVEDLRHIPEVKREAVAMNRLAEEIQRPFDLSCGPLLRTLLLQLDKDNYIFLITMHHIISDGWSLGVFQRELTVLYEAFVNERPSPLEELPIQYVDYSVWQREWLQGEVLEEQLAYWKENLANFSTLQLPTDRPRPAIQSDQGAWELVELGKPLTDSLIALSKRDGVTLFMTLLAAFNTLLHRYIGQNAIIVGSPIANRSNVKIENMIGFFVNTLALRTDLSGDPTFSQLLQRVGGITRNAYDHQDLPFERLVAELQPERNISHSPLFQVAFALQNIPRETFEITGLTVSSFPLSTGTAKFDLTLSLIEQPAGLCGIMEYNTDLFDRSTIIRMLGNFQTLLQGVVTNPDCRISQLPILTKVEARQLLMEWNATQTDYPRDICIHELFESQVQRDPHTVAVAYKDQQLTYSQLNERANQLAHHLRSLGIKRGSQVAVCLERSIEMVISMLGILKAGGAYVPLDLGYPPQRLSFILQDTGSNVLITREDLSNRFSEEGVQVVCLDRDKDLINTRPISDQETEACGDDLAYVMYTSGSTGTPKGVEVLHRGIVRLVCNTDYIQLGEADRVGHISNCSFDASTFEVWGALLSGAKLVVLDHETVLSPRMLADSLKSEGINVLLLTTAFFNLLAKESPQVLAGIGHLMFGGEAADPRWVRRVLDEKGTGRLLNLYGPTENTTVTTWYKVTSVPDGAMTVPIGRPIANTRVYVLDSNMEPVPVGVPGELYIGGDGLARGYLNRPDLTAERFVDDPFTQGPGSRLYRTGDTIRWLPDGILEFLGRKDDQVKLRGFRIELREIESVLSMHELVGEAVVLLREDEPGDKRLVAYVVQQPHSKRPEDQQSDTGLSASQVSHWAMLFNDYVYNQPSPYKDATFNTSGWNSSYTDQPIPEKEMREWVEDAVDQILSFHPGRVLEIGCGSGLLLFRIAPHCSRYWGTDISPRAIKYIREQLNKPDLKLSDIALFQREAEDFKNIESESFDAVILNSVVQYFPDIHYLLRVLEGAVNAVKPGGFVFVGDVRSLPLIETFHTSVQLHQAEDSLSLEELRQNIQRQMMEEDELAIDPAFFTALKQHLPKISQVAIRPKQGRYHNELTRFRYQVVIHVGPQADPPADIHWMDWQKEKLSPSEIRSLLSETEPEILGLRGVCNARISTAVEAVKLLKGNEGPKTAGELREMIARDKLAGIDPEDLWALSDELPYIADIRWGNNGSEDSFNVVFKRETSTKGRTSRRGISIPEERIPLKPWSEYANNPMQGESTREMESQLHNFLSEKLPEYMVPTAFVFLNTLPLTTNGKVDRKALPAPNRSIYLSGDSSVQFVGPRTPMEQALVEIWSDVLRRDGIGIHDNFFHLGGHSLLATQVISRVNETFGVSMPVAEMFEYPTVGEFTNELILRMQQEEFENEPPIKPAERKAEMPLSFAQQRLWFLDQFEPDSPAYNMSLAIEMTGELDQKALQKSLHELVRRHESLRSHFEMRDGQPVQLIDVFQPIDIPVIDLSEVCDSSKKEVHSLLKEESLQPFDLNHGPLFRVKLLRIKEADHILLLTMHHIVSDGWSMGVLFHELTVLYESYMKGWPSPLPELPIQYVDFAVWQRHWLSGQVLASQVDYWREQLSGNLPVLNLPTDYPRPMIQTFNGARESIQLSSELSESLKALSHREHMTMFMTLLSAFKVLLYRYTDQEDIIVGSPVANRNRTEIEGLIGFFVNMLVLRSQVSDTQSFVEFLAQVRKTTLGAYTHQDLPFERLVDEFAKDRDLSRSALFQVIFAMQNAPMSSLELVGLQLKPVEMKSQTTHFELEVHIWEREGQLQILFVYNRDLFAPSTIKRMMNHYQELLQGIVANPKCRICELPLISQQERQELFDVWNQTHTEYPQDTSIQALFELQVKQKSEALAVVFEDQQLTYGQLNERANQLAYYLRTLGVKRGSLVAVCLERSLEMVVSMLGILKAGGAYVPLDVNYPHQRLSFMLQDTGSHVLLTREDLLDRFSNEGVQVVCLDRDMDLISSQTVLDLKLEISGEDLAYVMYTSGSTGIPKGVEVLHRGVVRLLFGVDYVHLGPEETLLQLAPISFDASTFEIWGALLHGGRCVIFPSQVPTQEELGEVIDRYSVSTLWLTASLFNMIISESPQVLRGIKQLLTGGEALSVPHIHQALERLPDTQLINGYGPTENTTFTCCYTIPRQLPEGLSSIPIGRPIGNTRVYVLDTHMEPVPVGIPGELYIGGDGLARGYLNRPELTAERFVDDPFIEKPVSEGPDSRFYRTGDMVRWLPDGILEFLGRKDDQVKLRGFRIELGEIESVLNAHESVGESVVLLREDEPGEKRLVGYVIPRADVSPTLSFDDIRSYLRKRLPDYMVPSYFVQLESLPLTHNGKLDKSALPHPGIQRQSEKRFLQPQTHMEKTIASIWSEILNIGELSIYDNFFDLGGHSLLAIKVVTRLQENLGLNLPLRGIFENPTIKDLARFIETFQWAGRCDEIQGITTTYGRESGEL
jgi:amino acid adenylation domain-containing protein